MKKLFPVLCTLVLMFSACNRDDFEEVRTETDFPVPEVIRQFNPQSNPVNTSLTGFVIDENANPVSGAEVRVDDHKTTTDEFGNFEVLNSSLNAAGTVVRVEAPGYFNATKRLLVRADVQNRVHIVMIEKVFDQSFASGEGGSITLPEGGSIDFAPQGIVDEKGDPYSGTVQVATTWLRPDRRTTYARMPGNLTGVDDQNREVGMETFGMLGVEMQGDNGQTLNLAQGSPASVKLPIVSVNPTLAPEEMPLWSFYEPYGLWAQEGEAVKNGEFYEGEVPHFSFWNWDLPFAELVQIEARFIDSDGDPIRDLLVGFSLYSNQNMTGYGVTDVEGRLRGMVPKDETLLMEVFDMCGSQIYLETIGPLTDDTDLGDITIDHLAINKFEVTGELEDCSGNPVQSGAIVISYAHVTIVEYVTGGTFDFFIHTCDAVNQVDFYAINLDSAQQSQTMTLNLGAVNDLGTVLICDDLDENVLILTVVDSSSTYQAVYHFDSIRVTTDMTQFDGFTLNYYASLGFKGNTTGHYPDQENSLYVDDRLQGWILSANSAGVGTDQIYDFYVEEFGGPGELITGYFDAEMTRYVNPQMSGDTVDVHGVFQVRRYN